MQGMSEEVIGAVLAGGASRRMGEPKAMVELAGKPLIAHAVAAVVDAGLNPIVVAKPDSQVPDLGVPILDEPQEPRHPLCGIVAALRYAETRPSSCSAATCRSSPPPCSAPLPARRPGRDGRDRRRDRAPARPLRARRRARADGVAARRHRAARGDRGAPPPPDQRADLSAYGDPNRIAMNVNSPRTSSWRAR